MQGYGNAGRWFARFAHASGYPVVAISDSKGTVVNQGGLDPIAVERHKEETGGVAGADHADSLGPEDVFGVDAEAFVPAALEQAIHEGNHDLVRAKLVLEVANHPVTPAAGEALEARGVRVVPDILANAGGVVVSYFEWDSNRRRVLLSDEKADVELQRKMEQATDEVAARAHAEGATLRDVAYRSALKRVAEAELSRTRALAG